MSFVRTPLSLAIFATISTSAFADALNQNPIQQNENEKIALSTIVVEAEEKSTIGKTVYNQDDLKNTPNSSKNITDFLKVNPNVQFGTTFKSGLQQGEIKASDISINGGLAYDNKILINGMSTNNTINPIGADQPNAPNEIIGSSQAGSINADLICNLTVLDSNVSAEYGEFTGGVVSAETCAPQTEIGKIHGSVSYDYTSDSWTKYNFPSSEELEAFENSTDEAEQPYFTKQGLSLNTYAKLSETLGFNAFGSYRHSSIPLKTDLAESGRFEQKRESTNGGLELFIDPDEKTSIKIGASFFEDSGLYSQANILNSDATHASNSQNLYLQLNNTFDSVEIKQQLSYQTQEGSRETANDSYTWRKSENKNWGNGLNSFEGNLAGINQEESRLEYSIKALFNPIETGRLAHRFKLGAGYGHYDAFWQRAHQSNVYATPLNLKGMGCTAADGSVYEACDDSTTLDGKFDGQFLSAKTLYEAGQIDIRQDRWHAYIEDQIQWDQYLNATIGFRTDYDSINKNNNVAPRTAFEFKPFANDSLSLVAGWNRYYGLNAFANELSDRLDRFMHKYTRTDLEQGWIERNAGKNAYTYRSNLKTPYSDETVLGVSSHINNAVIALKWVNRDNKDQLRQTKMDLTDFSKTYDNSGRSESNIYTLSLSNLTPIEFYQTEHRLSLNADYTETTRNFDHYNSLNNVTSTPQIYYEGQIIDADDRPADQFNVPWTVRLGWDIALQNLPIRINNFISYQGKVDSLERTTLGYTDEQGIKYDMYTPHTTKNKFNWDMRATYTIPSFKDTQTILGLTINNVTNKYNYYINSNGDRKPDIGRQFIADITFKF